MSDNYIFVSGSDLVIPVESITGDPVVHEEMIIASQIANIDLNVKLDPQVKPPSAATDVNVHISAHPVNSNDHSKTNSEQKVNSVNSPMAVDVPGADEQTAENMSHGGTDEALEDEDKEEELLDEDAYIAFGPGGDPGPDKKMQGELNDIDEPDKQNGWRGDDDYDSYDSYFEEDLFDDDCF